MLKACYIKTWCVATGKNLTGFSSLKDCNIPDLQILRNWHLNFIVSFSFENSAI
jgi:hypothetical protein